MAFLNQKLWCSDILHAKGVIKLQNGAGLSGFPGFRVVFPGPKRVVDVVLKTKDPEVRGWGVGCGGGGAPEVWYNLQLVLLGDPSMTVTGFLKNAK